jgi:NAD(P)-dependent dehydrogenase (short-subunit alcohol dehydrogenase family)
MKQVSVLVGAGSIGQAIIRRVSAGKHVVLADYSVENAKRTAKTMEDAGFECSTIQCDLGSKEDILKLVEFATGKGEVTNVVNAAGVSPSQAPVEEILRVDLYGTSVLLDEFGKVIAEGGSGVIISSQSGHRLPALTQEQQQQLFLEVMADYADIPHKADRLKALKMDAHYNALQVKYAYAVTCHKAQGGQWAHVYLDQGYMTDDMLTPDYIHWLYTAFTRATEKLFLVNWPKTQIE